MASSSKNSESNNRDDCQIHVDKEGESCVIKIESVGQEKMLRELLLNFNSLKGELDQLLIEQERKQPQSKEISNSIQDIAMKLKPLEDQLQKVNKYVADDHIQLNKLHTDLNKKFDDIKQDLYSFKEQQKHMELSKDIVDKILQKLDNIDILKQQISTKNDIKSIIDTVQTLQISFDKEKTKPDILARKLDLIDQKMKETLPDHINLMKDVQSKIDPLSKNISQTSETLTKLNDRIKTIHADNMKHHPDMAKKLDDIDNHLKNQQNVIIEPMKYLLNEKLNPFIEKCVKKDEEEKLSSTNISVRDNDSNSPNRVPLCINGMIPVLFKLSDSNVLQALSSDITKKLSEIQTRLISSDEFQRKQNDFIGSISKKQDLLNNIESKLDHLSQNIENENDIKRRTDTQREIIKEISLQTQPIRQVLDSLSKQQKPLMETIQELPKKIDDIHQFQIQSNIIKEIRTQFDPLIQKIKEIKDGLNQQTQGKEQNSQALVNIEKKLNQTLNDSPKRSEINQDMEKALHPFSQIIKTLKDSIDLSQAKQQTEIKKLDDLEQSLSKLADISSKSLDITSPIMDKLNEIIIKLKQQQQIDPILKNLFEDTHLIKTFIEKQPTSDDILIKLSELIEKQKISSEEPIRNIDSKIESIQRTSKDFIDIKKTNNDIVNKIDKSIASLSEINSLIQDIKGKIDQTQPIKNQDLSKTTSIDLTKTLEKLDDQFIKQQQTNNLLNDIQNQLIHLNNNLTSPDSLKFTYNKFKENDNNDDSSSAIKYMIDRLKVLDDTIKELPDQILLKSKHFKHENEEISTGNSRQVPFNQSILNPTNTSAPLDGPTTNLFTNLLTLQAAIQCSDKFLCQHIPQYFKRIEQSSLVQNDRDLQELLKCVKDRCLDTDCNITHSNLQSNDPNKNFTNPINPLNKDINNNLIEQDLEKGISQKKINHANENKASLPFEYLTKSRYILFISEQSIYNNWPKLCEKAKSIIQAILNQPIDFDNGTNIDHLIKELNLEQYALLTRNAIKKSDKDYDKISYMMDSIVFDKMTMIGCREALIRPWNPSLLNQASSKGFYPYPSGNNSRVERFNVNKDISLWMVETDDSKPYYPKEFMPNISRLNDKYGTIQQPQFNEIRQKRREDETRWNERYAFTKDNRTILFVNDLRSYFMDYDTKRKYQVHDGVPINPVCRTGIAGRGDLPFWGPNHCVVVVLLRNINDPEVVLMKHHGDALVLPKGFYGHEARYDNQIKIIQDPVSGQILPPNLLEYWWSEAVKLNQLNHSINNIKRVLNDKELKEEFTEIFSQKGCNKSVFDNGYVDHPLNTDHAWVESSVWKVQFKDWRIPEMKAAKFIIADDFKNSHNKCSFLWVKLMDALLIVPHFDRGILLDVLATGMPL